MGGLVGDHRTQGVELGIPAGIDLPGCLGQRPEPVAIVDKILPPADEIDVLQQHLHLTSHE